jgi:hypothetical protein
MDWHSYSLGWLLWTAGNALWECGMQGRGTGLGATSLWARKSLWNDTAHIALNGLDKVLASRIIGAGISCSRSFQHRNRWRVHSPRIQYASSSSLWGWSFSMLELGPARKMMTQSSFYFKEWQSFQNDRPQRTPLYLVKIIINLLLSI